MSEIREKALAAAVQLGGGAMTIVQAAAMFADFLEGPAKDAKDAQPGPEPSPEPKSRTAEKPTTEKAKSVTKPAVEKAKPVAKPNEIDPDLKKLVGDKVNELLKANLREQAVELLGSFEATSATGIVKAGKETVDSFMEQADALLNGAAGNLAD